MSRFAPFVALALAACTTPTALDLDGRPVDPLASGETTVLVFVSTTCPLSNRYAPEIRRLAARDGGTRFYLVYPQAGETPPEIRDHLRAYGYALPALRDTRHALARRARVTVTPEAAVFRAGRLAWHGRIDDRFVDFGVERPAPAHRDLERALDAVRAGRTPDPPAGPPLGCAIERS